MLCAFCLVDLAIRSITEKKNKKYGKIIELIILDVTNAKTLHDVGGFFYEIERNYCR